MSNSPPTPSEDACSRHVHINPSHLDNLLRLFLALAQHMEVMLPELEQYDCLKCEHCGNVTHGISREPEDPWDSEEATLGAYQYTEIILSAHNRQDKWLAHNGDLMELEGEVLTEVEARVKAWILLWEDVTSGAGDGDLKMKRVALNWGEKVVTMLAEEWQEWMMRETMSLYNKEVSDV
ncbi:hypothetical protein ACG7TL_005435 [Trametes sanguinea]